VRELILVRHGQSTNNLLWEQTGSDSGRDSDCQLTDLGLQQAETTAKALADGYFGSRPTHLYTSLMTRAVQTAAPIARQLDLDLVAHPEVFEMSGVFSFHPETGERVAVPGAGRQALTRISDRLVWPQGHDEAGWWSGVPEDAERDAVARAARVLAELDARHSGDDVVAVVTHGAFSQYLVRDLLRITGMNGWFQVMNCAVSRFARNPDYDNWTLNWLARFDHLVPGLVSE